MNPEKDTVSGYEVYFLQTVGSAQEKWEKYHSFQLLQRLEQVFINDMSMLL